MLPKHRRPTTPGEILKYEFLEPLGMTQLQLATAIGITRVRVNEIILGKRSITTDTAFRLAQYFNTTPDFWLGLQMDVDMWDTLQRNAGAYKKIPPVKKTSRFCSLLKYFYQRMRYGYLSIYTFSPGELKCTWAKAEKD